MSQTGSYLSCYPLWTRRVDLQSVKYLSFIRTPNFGCYKSPPLNLDFVLEVRYSHLTRKLLMRYPPDFTPTCREPTEDSHRTDTPNWKVQPSSHAINGLPKAAELNYQNLPKLDEGQILIVIQRTTSVFPRSELYNGLSP